MRLLIWITHYPKYQNVKINENNQCALGPIKNSLYSIGVQVGLSIIVVDSLKYLVVLNEALGNLKEGLGATWNAKPMFSRRSKQLLYRHLSTRYSTSPKKLTSTK